MTTPTDSPPTPPWPTCQAADACGAGRAGDNGACLAHLAEPELAGWLATLGPGSDLDLRGTQVPAERLARLLTALQDEHGRPQLGYADFGWAQFTGAARFSGAQFTKNAWFVGAQFTGSAHFDGAKFDGDAVFHTARFTESADFEAAEFTGPGGFGRAEFTGHAGFGKAQFAGSAEFSRAQFADDAAFSEAQFARSAKFGEAKFAKNASFQHVGFNGTAEFRKARFAEHADFLRAYLVNADFAEAKFAGEAFFGSAQFAGDARFYKAEFTGDVWFASARFAGSALFGRVRFARPVVLGPLAVRGTLNLAGASFEDTMVIKASTLSIQLNRAACAAGINLQLRYAQVLLDGLRLAQPMTVAAADPFTRSLAGLDETGLAPPGWSPVPRLHSVRGTDVAQLVITDLSLAPCQFAGAHHLDQVRLEGAISFAQPPRGLHVGRAWPPVWWWTRRQTLAEEHAWRATRPKRAGWYGPETRPSYELMVASGHTQDVIGPERLTGLYRALRQAQENRKNEPGAADFYYGEMEMRRLAPGTPWAERMILFAYWLVAGYGLRGLRALGLLVLATVLAAVAIHEFGFQGDMHSWPRTLVYAAGAATRLVNPPEGVLNDLGQAIRISMGLLGPLLVGLTVLAVRNRVKR